MSACPSGTVFLSGCYKNAVRKFAERCPLVIRTLSQIDKNHHIDEFIDILDTYIRWYSTNRIKMSLGAMSPIEYRRSLGLIA